MSGYGSPSSSTPSVKHRRRHCNLSPSDIQIARDFVGIGDDEPSYDQANRLLLVPPSSARLPKTPSPEPSPDPFRLTFTEGSYTFPRPPTTSSSLKVMPPACTSSGESSPAASALPLTPSSSSENLLRPGWQSKRGAPVQPLVIQPYFHQGIEIEASIPEVYESWEDKVELNTGKASSFSLSPYCSSFLDSDSSDESSSDSEDGDDIDAESEWYTRELSQVVCIEQPARPHSQTSRPESMFIRPRKDSLVLPAPSKRTSKRSIPSPMRSPAHTRPISVGPSSPSSISEFSTQYLAPPSPAPSRALPSPRPPPRNSVPVDLDDDLDDTTSAFSLALYQHEGASPSLSQTSFYGAEAVYGDNEIPDFGSPLDTATFDLDADHRMMLPLSLPGTPIDLETDIANGLEELRRGPMSPLPSVREESTEDLVDGRPATPISLHSSAWSFGTPSPASSRFKWGHGNRPSISFSHASSVDKPAPATFDEERVLKSRWSSSTLASIQEEHSKRISSPRLKLGSFLSTSPSKKRTSAVGAASPSSPPRPLSPISFMKKRSSTSRKAVVEELPSISTLMPPTHGVESPSEDGLKRKPIPLELLLRL